MRIEAGGRIELVALAAGLMGCARGPAASSAPIRLADLYRPEMVEGRSASPPVAVPRTEWRFDGPAPASAPPKLAATRGWEAGPGVSGLAIRSGRLVGRTESDLPIVHFERTSGLEDHDLLHAVEVRARVSAGGTLAFSFRGSEKIDLAQVAAQARGLPWRLSTPIVPGDEARTYAIETRTFARGVTSSEIRHLLIQPTDAKGASFEIESVRLVFRKEHLQAVPSGVGWHGLSEIYRETLASRSPEKIRMTVTLPRRPRLELALGTLENGPVTFRVGLRPERSARDETVLLERTVTTPHRWEAAAVDLAPFAGQAGTLSLSLSAEKPGALGFWGGPTIRDLAARPAASATTAQPPQGVILIFVDTLRRDHLDVYGYPRETAPVVRRMAAEGALFRDCVGQATWTKVATPSLMTGLYPASHGVREFTHRLPNAAVTLAEVLRDAGYATLSMSSILFTGRFTNLHQGFEEVHEDSSLPDRESSKTARVYVDRLLPWLDAHRDLPFFVFLHVSDPHDPYKPYPPYDTLWADPAGAAEHERQAREVRKVIADPLMKLFGMPSREELKKAGFDADGYVAYDRDWYDGSIRGMDAEIGRLLERLRTLGLDGKTLVVFTGDHGEEFLEHGRTFHGQTTYGELSNEPLILWRPGAVPKGLVVEETVEAIDVMPTILEMCGLRAPDAVQGRSLLPLLGGGPAAHAGTVRAAEGWRARPAIVEKARTFEKAGAPPPHDTESFAVVSGDWKLVHNAQRPDEAPEYELYDHREDPLDRASVASEHPDVVQRLARDLEAWRRHAEAARLKPDSESTKALSKEQLERLRALGYVQ